MKGTMEGTEQGEKGQGKGRGKGQKVTVFKNSDPKGPLFCHKCHQK